MGNRTDHPFVFLLNLPEIYLLYAPLHGFTALMNQRALYGLDQGKRKRTPRAVREMRKVLYSSPEFVPEPRTGDFLPDFIGLIPTRGCNLNCSYCGFRSSEKDPAVMTSDTVKICIEWYARLLRDHGRKVMNIHFFGGEPFHQPSLCRFAVDAARVVGEKYGMRVVFEAATNGFMSAETAAFVRDSIDTIVLSLDGPAGVHNMHRPQKNGAGSFDVVYRNARIFSQGSGNLCLRSCITSETVERMQEIAKWFCSEFRPQAISFETLQASTESVEAGLRVPNPWKFGLAFVRAEEFLERFGVKAVYATAETSASKVSFCPVGRDVAIISPDRKITGCYLLEQDWKARGMDLHLGEVSGSGTFSISEESITRLRKINVWNKPRCENCFCRWSCASGCHVHHTYPGCKKDYDSLCIQTRIITLYRILKSLGKENVFHRLSENRRALRKVILRKSDRLDSQPPGPNRKMERYV